RFLGDLAALQRKLRDRVTAQVRDRRGTGAVDRLSEEERAEIELEVSDTWLLWRHDNGMDDQAFEGFAGKELALYFADMAPLMPYYWQVPVVRAALESHCQQIPGALPTESGSPGP
ncbi:MAG: hypothetical protein M3Z21_02805, partial [Pseudomonadota bacterium]|nr:hypothetical protein [Pseudomonadota bacterium]